MPKKPEGYLTKIEKKNPLGAHAEGMTDQKIVEQLKNIDFLTEKLELTRRGNEYVSELFSTMTNVERLMIERFILEHHQIKINVEYDN